ncbi:hypothetical protein L4D20_03440 [Vibrio kyushuensis]|uniref:hypothetical protein n=1 Tax=Vibrio kyushuensis TaxID=2910249 RepID=UPI003D12AE05
MKREFELYVSRVGILSVNLMGSHIDEYIHLPNTEVVRRKIRLNDREVTIRTLIVNFTSENENIAFLQNLVDKGAPFTDDYKSTSYMTACKLVDEGKLKGKILGC